MCRMFAVVSQDQRSYEDLLLADGNCLLKQSNGDHRDEKHHDGWGLGWYEVGIPHVAKSPRAASGDPQFSRLAREIRSPLIIAHVRQASVGLLTEENCHPFLWRQWLFAHNGTIEHFDHLRSRMESEMTPQWLALRRGTTDSELLFLWLLARGERSGIDWLTAAVETSVVVDLVRDGVRDVAGWSAEFPPPASGEPTRLNLLLSDGRGLLAVRWQYDLHYCQQPREVIVSSEPIGAGSWREMTEPSILTVSATRQIAISAF